jgi:hypothetical protein
MYTATYSKSFRPSIKKYNRVFIFSKKSWGCFRGVSGAGFLLAVQQHNQKTGFWKAQVKILSPYPKKLKRRL